MDLRKVDDTVSDTVRSGIADMLFAGKVTYDASTVKRMERVRYRTFHLSTTVARIFCAVIMVVCGYLTGGVMGTLFVAFGCILAVSGDITGRWRADQTIKALAGGSISVRYEFYDRYFLSISNGEPLRCEYTDLILLMEDEQYFYLYPNQFQVYMIAAGSLEPDRKESFRELLAGEGDLTWIRPLSLLTANLKTVTAFHNAVSKGKKRKEINGYS